MTKDNPYHNKKICNEIEFSNQSTDQHNIFLKSFEVASKLGLGHWGWIFRFPISWGCSGFCQQPVSAVADAYVQFGGHHINSGAGTHSYCPTEQGKHGSSASWAAVSAGFNFLILNPFVLSKWNQVRNLKAWKALFHVLYQVELKSRKDVEDQHLKGWNSFSSQVMLTHTILFHE